MMGRFGFDRPPLAAHTLITDTSILTAIGNDYGFDDLFARQLQACMQEGDILLAISTSGTSHNIVRALDVCFQRGGVALGYRKGRGYYEGSLPFVHCRTKRLYASDSGGTHHDWARPLPDSGTNSVFQLPFRFMKFTIQNRSYHRMEGPALTDLLLTVEISCILCEWPPRIDNEAPF